MRAAPDATPADRLGPRLMVWGTRAGTPVGAVVPADYAAWSGHQLHTEVQWERLISPARRTEGPPPWSDGPVLGHLPAVVARPLVAVLRAHTVSPERCWLCVWDGWGGWEHYAPDAPESSSRTAATGS